MKHPDQRDQAFPQCMKGNPQWWSDASHWGGPDVDWSSPVIRSSHFIWCLELKKIIESPFRGVKKMVHRLYHVSNTKLKQCSISGRKRINCDNFIHADTEQFWKDHQTVYTWKDFPALPSVYNMCCGKTETFCKRLNWMPFATRKERMFSPVRCILIVTGGISFSSPHFQFVAIISWKTTNNKLNKFEIEYVFLCTFFFKILFIFHFLSA